MIIKNFLFHRVSDETDPFWPPMPTDLFESVIAHILKNHCVVQLEDYLGNGKFAKNGKTPATISFDDGYKDNIEYAVPILDKYKCPASFYVVTDCIDNNIPTWTYIMDHLFQHTSASKLMLEMDFVLPEFREISFTSKPEKLDFGIRLKAWMKTLSNVQRKQVLTHLHSAFSHVGLPLNKMMNWNDLRQMQNAGYRVGSHTVSHPVLASIENEHELFSELKDSGERIKSQLGEFPCTISYPIGSYNEKVIALSKQAGYRLGLAVHQRFYETSRDDQFAIPRVELYNESMWKNKLRVSGVYSWIKKKIK